ncbi:unnamed protein product [Lactuca virosa]|uniref:Peptidase M16C associated domain-containing protein n=1 Tax=Lactuca virosa TaxID=75947 RepID=A0AAU9LU94_9ASTR|nr:unnamed protein product [Lactuca virosa]
MVEKERGVARSPTVEEEDALMVPKPIVMVERKWVTPPPTESGRVLICLDNLRSLLEMGTKDINALQLSQLIGRETGGISVYPFTSSKQGSKNSVSHVIVRGKAMSANTEALFNPMTCVLQEAEFTNSKRFKRYLEFLKDLEGKIEENWSEISMSREEIHQTLLAKKIAF